MKSAGNDIVALTSIDKERSNEARFYSQILTTAEQALYGRFQDLPFEYYLWLLWSVKESAYKFLKRIDTELVFSPTKITIENITATENTSVAITGYALSGGRFYQGKVVYNHHTLYFRSTITAEWISSVVNHTNDFSNMCYGIQKIPGTGYEQQSAAAKALLLSQLTSFLPGDLSIGKSPVGYPVILNHQTDLNIPASLSHDGHFVGFVFVKPQTNC